MLSKTLQAAAGNAAEPIFIEDTFSCYLYTGNGSTQTITNGIDLSGEGGLVWLKSRGPSGYNHYLYDTIRGATKVLFTNLTNAEGTQSNGLTTFNSNGFTQGSFIGSNGSGETYASWTFRKAPKFFDVVTYTGDGNPSTNIAHSLGSTPGCVLIKATSGTSNWFMWHRGNGTTDYSGLSVNNTAAAFYNGFGGQSGFTSTTFRPYWVDDSSGNAPITNGVTYVAYLFAHDAGGFGLTGTDNVISCGSYTGNSSTTGPIINLGYEPQWVLIKCATNGSPDWWLFDNMRGVATGGVDMGLRPNTSGAEVTGNDYLSFNATGFQPTNSGNAVNASPETYIYIAIRRPMKPPTAGTEVYYGGTFPSGTGAKTFSSPILTDMIIPSLRSGAAYNFYLSDRLRGATFVQTLSTAAEAAANVAFDVQTGIRTTASWYSSGDFAWSFKRASGFFDVVCYSGNSVSNQAQNHNLGVVPELYILKCRSSAQAAGWLAYTTLIDGSLDYLTLNSTAAKTDSTLIAPTSTQFYLSNQNAINGSGFTYVGYFFASVPGVSKVGTYTGNGSSQTINCGFTSGARFVLIKRTDSTGDWYVWDSARGIVAGNDPHLSLNTTAAEVTTDDSVDADSTGFIVNQLAATNINVTSATYIFLSVS